jgi:pimeloyl-ACP methyl ester carboxylesterase
MEINKPIDPAVQAAYGYAAVNGLQMYYEIHGAGKPLVLLHGNLSNIETDFGRVIPLLARTRQVIGVEQQAHGHTADIDRPVSLRQMAEDTVELLRQLGIQQADFFGYSVGSGIAMQIATRHPEMVRKLALASASYKTAGLHPEVLPGVDTLQPEHLAGTPFHESYLRLAPRPGDWPRMIARGKEVGRDIQDWRAEDIQAIQAPTLLIIGDSDIVRPEHAAEMFRLLGGGVPGDLRGLPKSRLAVLPGTTHITLVHRADWLSSMIAEFLDEPMPEAK